MGKNARKKQTRREDYFRNLLMGGSQEKFRNEWRERLDTLIEKALKLVNFYKDKTGEIITMQKKTEEILQELRNYGGEAYILEAENTRTLFQHEYCKAIAKIINPGIYKFNSHWFSDNMQSENAKLTTSKSRANK